MTRIEPQLDRILADPLRLPRAAGNALGYVGADIPLDLLLATGRAVSHLPWSADRPTPLADQWLESSFPGLARSILEDWALGQFDCFGQVLFSRGDDSSQRLYYYVCELQRRGLIAGPEPLIFDIARIPRETSLRHTRASLERLATRLNLSTAQLHTGIQGANLQRLVHERVGATRAGTASLYEKIGRASLFADVAPLLQDYPPGTEPAARRVLLAGSAPPDDRLHQAIQSAGAAVVAEWHERTAARLGPCIPVDADPLTAIARQRHGMALGPRGFGDAAAALVTEARRVRADAVVLWLTREDEALAWHVPAQRQQLGAAGIPALVLTARRWDASDGAAQEISAYFSGEIR